MGRTPLAWAAARGDAHTVVALLSHGADPNIIDAQISGPVSNAATQGYTACVRLLLEAGAYPDAPLPTGMKKGSPLNVAARRSNDISLIKSLLDFGADVESSGVDGMTCLNHAARMDNASFAMLFLEHGANINAVSVSGNIPLTTAITHNSHNVLRLILDRWHEYTDCPRLQGPNLLHITSTYADIDTIQILASIEHLQVRQDRAYGIGDFNDRLRRRVDHTEKLSIAFEELLKLINGTIDKPKSSEKLMEEGCPISLRTRMKSSSEYVMAEKQDTSEWHHVVSCPGGWKDEDESSSENEFVDATEIIGEQDEGHGA